MIYRTPQSEIDKYFEDTEHVSQSALKKLLKGVEAFKSIDEKSLYYEEKGHFIIGGGVDTFLTQGEEEFERQYYWFKTKKPSAAMMSVCQELFDKTSELGLPMDQLSVDIILEVANSQQYRMNYGDAAKVKAVIKDGQEYYNELVLAGGRQICDDDQWKLIHEIVHSLQESEVTGNLFDNIYGSGEDVDIIYQLPIYFELEGVKYKALLDMIVINHVNKNFRVFDLKTMGDYLINFPMSVRRHRYDIQANMYALAIEHKLNQIEKIIGKNITDYSHKPFSFVVESTINPGSPIIAEVSQDLLYLGYLGRKRLFVDKIPVSSEIKGIKYLMDEYKWYLENGFDNERLFKEKHNIVKLDWLELS